MNAAGKFYDAQKSNDYFTTIRSSLDDYQGDAAKLNAAFAVFATDESERGRQAEATQELVGIGEKGLVDRMTDIHTQIKDATDHIKSSFEESVDAASDALIEMDTLEALQNDFEAFYKTYDDLGTQIEDIATILQSKYGEYATFEMPDFETGREAFKEFCGGASGSGGFLRECMDKFDEFDRTETAYLMGLGLEELLNELQTIVNSTSTIFASLDMSDPEVAAQALCDVKLDPVTGDILVKGKNGDWEPITEDQVQRLKEKLGEEGFCELRKNLLYSKYENGQQDLIDVIRVTNTWSGAMTVDYQTYVDIGIIDEHTYDLIKDFIVIDGESGKYRFETAMEAHTSGNEKLTDAQLKAIGFIYATNMTEYELLESVEQVDARGNVAEKLVSGLYYTVGPILPGDLENQYTAYINKTMASYMLGASEEMRAKLQEPDANDTQAVENQSTMAIELINHLSGRIAEQTVSSPDAKCPEKPVVSITRGDTFYDTVTVSFHTDGRSTFDRSVLCTGIYRCVDHIQNQPEGTYTYVNSLGIDCYAIAGTLLNIQTEEDASFLDQLFKVPNDKEETYSALFLSHNPYELSNETGVSLAMFSMKVLDKGDDGFYNFANGMLACNKDELEYQKGVRRKQYLKLLSNGSCAYASVVNSAAIDYLMTESADAYNLDEDRTVYEANMQWAFWSSLYEEYINYSEPYEFTSGSPVAIKLSPVVNEDGTNEALKRNRAMKCNMTTSREISDQYYYNEETERMETVIITESISIGGSLKSGLSGVAEISQATSKRIREEQDQALAELTFDSVVSITAEFLPYGKVIEHTYTLLKDVAKMDITSGVPDTIDAAGDWYKHANDGAGKAGFNTVKDVSKIILGYAMDDTDYLDGWNSACIAAGYDYNSSTMTTGVYDYPMMYTMQKWTESGCAVLYDDDVISEKKIDAIFRMLTNEKVDESGKTIYENGRPVYVMDPVKNSGIEMHTKTKIWGADMLTNCKYTPEEIADAYELLLYGNQEPHTNNTYSHIANIPPDLYVACVYGIDRVILEEIENGNSTFAGQMMPLSNQLNTYKDDLQKGVTE